ncbi:phytanoyl-CoA dioxygenase family protein [Nostoc sp. NMS9]|uniref:phytanoyl-CoA dioxygenase family protein n=1 Tax=Nostoc sp. NMS9 TaxID=2815393 RepID=UPI0025ECDF72|nr:phytanoyl-CoA dioxygenase family protein [Nostoc sp. NMS9]MBN3939336.1 phytanoyl-CoA dioxygenase family protein [Nostoc sp. NMS9]
MSSYSQSEYPNNETYLSSSVLVGKELEKQGWLLFENIVDNQLVEKLKLDLDKANTIARHIQIKNDVSQNTDGTINHLLGLGDSFMEFLERMYLKEAITSYFCGNYILNIFGGVNNLKNHPSYLLNIHRDVRSFTGNLKLMLQMIVMLDDFTLENGATYFMNGGHYLADRPSEKLFYENSTRAVGKSGSIILFDANLWHAAGSNQTDEPRRALTLCFTKPFVKQQLDLPRYFGYDYATSLSEEMKQILGYNALVPTNLEEWYQPPEKRFYKPGQG